MKKIEDFDWIKVRNLELNEEEKDYEKQKNVEEIK